MITFNHQSEDLKESVIFNDVSLKDYHVKIVDKLKQIDNNETEKVKFNNKLKSQHMTIIESTESKTSIAEISKKIVETIEEVEEIIIITGLIITSLLQSPIGPILKQQIGLRMLRTLEDDEKFSQQLEKGDEKIRSIITDEKQRFIIIYTEMMIINSVLKDFEMSAMGKALFEDKDLNKPIDSLHNDVIQEINKITKN